MANEPRRKDQPDRLAKMQSDVGILQHQVRRMEQNGGFADAKTLSKRCMRIEQRLDKVERAVERQGVNLQFLVPAVTLLASALADHLKDRHQANLVTGAELDVHGLRQARRQLIDGAAALGELFRRTGA